MYSRVYHTTGRVIVVYMLHCIRMIRIIYLVLLFLTLSKASPRKRSEATCDDGSAALKEFLLRQEDWFPSGPHVDIDFDYVFEGIMGFPVDDFPNDFLCDFEGVTSLGQLYDQLESTGYIQIAFKAAYNYFSISGYRTLKVVAEEIQNPHPWSNITELQIKLDTYTHLAEAGMLSMNHEGFMWMFGLGSFLTESMTADIFYDEDELSTDPLDTQVLRVSNDLRKIWNMIQWRMSQYDPQASETMRDGLFEWTGIRLPRDNTAHDYIQLIFTDILRPATLSRPLIEEYRLFESHNVLISATRAVYPHVCWAIARAEEEIHHIPDTQRPEYLDLLLLVMESMNNMGLLDLYN